RAWAPGGARARRWAAGWAGRSRPDPSRAAAWRRSTGRDGRSLPPARATRYSPRPMSEAEPSFLRDVPYMGVIWVVHEASKLGFVNGHPDWCNLGQGQPEVGPMEGAPPRIETVTLQPADHAYGPLGGLDELREAVAGHVNRLF